MDYGMELLFLISQYKGGNGGLPPLEEGGLLIAWKESS
jgi:hypothetical protein